MNVHEALAPPRDVEKLRDLVPELDLARGLQQSPFHHLDTLDHVLEVIGCVEREIEERELGVWIGPDRAGDLRFAALLHDIAKPITRGEVDGKVLFVAHDSLGAGLAHRICRRLGISAALTDLASTLTALHLKIGFMENPASDYPPRRLARAAGPFGEELAVLSWADRLAAQGPRLKDEHIERHLRLCRDFLQLSHESGPYLRPDYEQLGEKLSGSLADADIGYGASRLRLLEARGLDVEDAIRYVYHVLHTASG